MGKAGGNDVAKVPGRNQLSFIVPEEVAERLRNAVWHIGKGATVKGVCAEAILKKVEELERKHNNGVPFSQRETELPKSSRRKKEAD